MTSKRNLERRIERIDDGNHPKLSLAVLLSSDEIETIDEDRGLVQVDGTVYNGAGLKRAFEDL